jgi:hypothetical protein
VARVTVEEGRFGSTRFMLGRRELGHVHGSSILDGLEGRSAQGAGPGSDSDSISAILLTASPARRSASAALCSVWAIRSSILSRRHSRSVWSAFSLASRSARVACANQRRRDRSRQCSPLLREI